MTRLGIIFTGDELLCGSTLNTNIQYLGEALTQRALRLHQAVTIPDSRASLHLALGNLLETCGTVLLCGGLGSTSDDITLDACAGFFGLELKQDENIARQLQCHWQKRHTGNCPKFMLRQARVPEGARVLPNSCGTAPGIAFSTVYAKIPRQIYLLPGPPGEFQAMLETYVLPELEKSNAGKIYTLGFLAPNQGEIFINRLVDKLQLPGDLSCAYTAKPDGCRCFVSGPSEDAVKAAVERIREALPLALAAGELDLAAVVIKTLAAKTLTLSCAESCTGGMISARLTDVPGASQVFAGGAVTYSNELKMHLLNVNASTLEEYGAVSRQCAEEMVNGICRNCQTHCGIAATGIAGPDGGTPEKPVGLVYLGLAVNGKVTTRELRLAGSREHIRQRTAAIALSELYQLLLEE